MSFVRYQRLDYLERKLLLKHLTIIKAGMKAVTPNCFPFTVLYPHKNRYRLSALPRECGIKFGVFLIRSRRLISRAHTDVILKVRTLCFRRN